VREFCEFRRNFSLIEVQSIEKLVERKERIEIVFKQIVFEKRLFGFEERLVRNGGHRTGRLDAGRFGAGRFASWFGGVWSFEGANELNDLLAVFVAVGRGRYSATRCSCHGLVNRHWLLGGRRRLTERVRIVKYGRLAGLAGSNKKAGLEKFRNFRKFCVRSNQFDLEPNSRFRRGSSTREVVGLGLVVLHAAVDRLQNHRVGNGRRCPRKTGNRNLRF